MGREETGSNHDKSQMLSSIGEAESLPSLGGLFGMSWQTQQDGMKKESTSSRPL
jgi:hypothetical protein